MEIAAVSRQNSNMDLLPIPFWQSLGFFGIPWLLFVICIYILLPALHRASIPLFLNFLISLGIPLSVLLVASWVAFQGEEQSRTWNTFGDCFRLGAMKPATWLWAIGLSIFMFLAPALLSFTADWILQIVSLPEPLLRMFDIQPQAFMGIPLAGNWWIVPCYLIYVVLNVGGEELWWRGYIFPRQELAFGKWTWLIHGIFWTLFHSFFYWEVIQLLPGCLALSFVAYKTKSTWPGIVAHFVNSFPSLVLILIGVMS
jgi:membrane protease YdiL (CAAX protease family)